MTIRRIYIILLFLLLHSAFCFSQSEKARIEIDLNGWWRFCVDSLNRGEASGWFEPASDKSYWTLVKVPIAFDNCAPGLDRYSGAGWFAKEINIPESLRGRRVVLHFEGINYNAKVWLNGKPVGENHDAFLPFELPVTEQLQYGKNNTIVVYVNNIRERAQFPLFEGWFGQGGFLREASLIATNHAYIAKSRVVATANIGQGNIQHGGSLALKTTVRNESRQNQALRLRVDVKDKKGTTIQTLLSQPVMINAGREEDMQVSSKLQGVKWWSPESPNLYSLDISVMQDGRAADRYSIRTGFRTIETRNARIYINGKEIYLKGFNRHEDSPVTGMAVDLKQVREDLETMKAMGCNFLRLCHYPHHPGELDLADELGFFVLAENAMNEWGHIDHPAPNPAIPLLPEDAPLVVRNGKRTLTKMIDRDNHHPSIILWSVSNENEEVRDDVSDGNSELIQFGKILEPTRLWTHVSNSYKRTSEWEKFYRYDDVIVVNVYPTHWYKPSEADLDAGLPLSTKIMRDTLLKLHKRYPDKAIVVGEYGFPGGFADMAGAKKQAIATEAEFKGMDAPYVAGGSLWVYARHPWPWENNKTSGYGYVSRNRQTRFPALAVVERLYKSFRKKY